MKKVLMIAYYYPPIAGGGVQRSSKFVKFLPKFNWQPYVLTVKSGYDYYSDNSLEKDVMQNQHVFRTISFEPMQIVRKLLKKNATPSQTKKDRKIVKPGNIKKHPWLLTIKESIFIPDAEIGWLPFAVWRGWRLMRQHKIDVIYSTSCPYTDHLIAWCLKKLTGKPWLADFRDPWSLHLKAPQFAWRRFWDRKLEKMVLRSADTVVTVTRLIAKDFQRIVPNARYSVITNGFDEDDFQRVDRHKYETDKFNMTYSGILYKERSPKFFLVALVQLLEEKPALRSQIRVRFVGQLDNPGDSDNYNYLKSLKLDDVIEFIPYVTHLESINYVSTADVALLIIDNVRGSEGIMTGKIFEYLRSGTPILALAPPEGAAAELVRTTKSGLVVASNSVEQIKLAIGDLFQSYRVGTLSHRFPRQGIERYSRRNLTQRLANEFNQLLAESAV